MIGKTQFKSKRRSTLTSVPPLFFSKKWNKKSAVFSSGSKRISNFFCESKDVEVGEPFSSFKSGNCKSSPQFRSTTPRFSKRKENIVPIQYDSANNYYSNGLSPQFRSKTPRFSNSKRPKSAKLAKTKKLVEDISGNLGPGSYEIKSTFRVHQNNTYAFKSGVKGRHSYLKPNILTSNVDYPPNRNERSYRKSFVFASSSPRFKKLKVDKRKCFHKENYTTLDFSKTTSFSKSTRFRIRKKTQKRHTYDNPYGYPFESVNKIWRK